MSKRQKVLLNVLQPPYYTIPAILTSYTVYLLPSDIYECEGKKDVVDEQVTSGLLGGREDGGVGVGDGFV